MKAVIIGCGLIAQSHANAIAKNEDTELVGVCDVVFEKAERLAAEYSTKAYQDAEVMLQQTRPDFAVICVPTFLHRDYVDLCAKNNINVLCEKPLERNYSQCSDLVRIVEDSNISFMTAQVVRFWPGYVEIKKAYEAGEFGDVLMLHLRRVSSRDSKYASWLFDPELGGGAMHDMLVHDVDYLLYLCGDYQSVYANAKQDVTGCYNDVFANIVHKNGTHSVAQVSFNMQEDYPFSFSVTIVGTKKTLEYKYSAGTTIADRSASQMEMNTWSPGKGKEELSLNYDVDPYCIQMDYFVNCLKTNIKPSIVTPRESLRVVQMMDAIHLSADSNTVVQLSD